VNIPDSTKVNDSELDQIAMATLLIGRLLLLMESGARAEVVHEDCSAVAHGFGADHPRQGQYTLDAKAYRPADLTVERIGDLLTHDLPALLLPEMTR
jgi:hypothetical protein